MTASNQRCPFDLGSDPDRAAIWDMLVARDIAAYVAGDWSMVEDDFVADCFFGIDAGKTADVDRWGPRFASLEAYRAEWLRQARETHALAVNETVASDLHALTDLSRIEVAGDFAIAHKKFDGTVRLKSGASDTLRWQTLYICRRVAGRWKIAGFCGYLPYPLAEQRRGGAKVPIASRQHATAGPYSPVLRVRADADIVVISGQVPLDLAGNIIGETIEEQARVTLENCRTQLKAAGLDLADAFKVNVYLTDLDHWPRFNAVYREIVPEPFPVRTAIGCALLPGFLVEIELWAAVRR